MSQTHSGSLSIPAYPLGRKICTYRGHYGRRWLPIHDFHVHTWEFDKRGEKVGPKKLGSWCKTCMRINQRERMGYQQKKPSKIGLRSKPTGGYIIETEEERQRYNEHRRFLQKNMTPEQKRNRRETQRFWAEKKRREEGVKPRNFKKRNNGSYKSVLSAQAAGEERYPIEPIRQYLLDKDITQVPGVSYSTLGQIRNGSYEADTVSLDLIDRILTGMDEQYLLNILYPL